MTFKDFVINAGISIKNGAVNGAIGLYNLPGTLASGVTTAVFGDPSINYVEETVKGNGLKQEKTVQYLVNEKNEFILNGDDERISPTIFTKMKKYGLVGTIGNGAVATFNFIGKAVLFIGDIALKALTAIAEFAMKAVTWIAGAITNFVNNHKQAITNIFWITLALAATAAVIGAIVAAANPVAFAAFVGFTVGGVSIASIAGASVAAQIGVTAGLVAAVTAIGSGLATTIYNGISSFVGWVKERRKAFSSNETFQPDDIESYEFMKESTDKINNTLNSSNTIKEEKKEKKEDQNIENFQSPLTKKKEIKKEEIVINNESKTIKFE